MHKRKQNELHQEERLLLTIPEVALLLGVSRAQVYNYIQKEGLPTVKIGKNGDQKVYKSSLERWIQHHETCAIA